MIEISSDQMKDFYGFTVYDAVTGDPVDASTILKGCSYFALDDDGMLVAISVDKWRDADVMHVAKEGRYLIQFADGYYMRW